MRRATASLLGTGLIGSSIGVALRAAGYTVVAWDPDPSHLEGAEDEGFGTVVVNLHSATFIEKLNQAWGTSHGSWAALAEIRTPPDEKHARQTTHCRMCAKRFPQISPVAIARSA